MEDTIKLYELPNNSRFSIALDENRPRKIFFFKQIDGMYGQVFENEADAKKFKNPAFLEASVRVIPIKDKRK